MGTILGLGFRYPEPTDPPNVSVLANLAYDADKYAAATRVFHMTPPDYYDARHNMWNQACFDSWDLSDYAEQARVTVWAHGVVSVGTTADNVTPYGGTASISLTVQCDHDGTRPSGLSAVGVSAGQYEVRNGPFVAMYDGLWRKADGNRLFASIDMYGDAYNMAIHDMRMTLLLSPRMM